MGKRCTIHHNTGEIRNICNVEWMGTKNMTTNSGFPFSEALELVVSPSFLCLGMDVPVETLCRPLTIISGCVILLLLQTEELRHYIRLGMEPVSSVTELTRRDSTSSEEFLHL